jgi:dihydroorotate dehydrogenase (fumarate)
MDLRTPLVPSASPLSDDIDNIRRMEDAGAAAVVLHSLFEEQITREYEVVQQDLMYARESFAEALTYLPEPAEFALGPDGYLNHIRKAKEAVRIPIVASLNGASIGGWVDHARKIQQAGADALELNIYFIPANPNQSSAEIEQSYVDIVQAVRSVVTIPVALKLSPFFTNMAYMARKFDKLGVNALVLFNRFYQPDLDLETLEVRPNVILSTAEALRLPLRWIAILYGNVRANLAATSGVHGHLDVLKLLMAGADVTMLCSELLQRGIGRIREIEGAMCEWMAEHDYQSVRQLQGSMSQKNCADPGAFERAQYMRALVTYRTQVMQNQ